LANGHEDKEPPRAAKAHPAESAPALTPNWLLALWHGVMQRAIADEHPDLTARQFALLLHIYLTPPPHTVRGLAAALKISKPAVTRALDRLSAYQLLRRKRDETDKRNVLVQRTIKGSVYLRDFGDLAARVAKGV
jgi:DNA-binding MarR family transcriptional regulator